jgi:hypothetical protein
MLEFKQYLNETFVNLFNDDQKKFDIADDVWNILVKSYSKIGGLKGAGFKDKADMVKNIPFWKLGKKDGKIILVIMYKDKGGRKLVAIGTDGSPESKQLLQNVFTKEFERSYFEISGPLLRFLCKNFDLEFLKKYAKTPAEVEVLLKEKIRKPIERELDAIPLPLRSFVYSRQLGDEIHNKVMFGTSGKVIVT